MVLLAALLTGFAAVNAAAQTDWRRPGAQKEAICQGSCGGGCGPCSGSASPTPSGPSPEEVRQQKERARLKAKEWSSDEALDYFDRKDWDNAIRSFEEALDHDPDDPDLNEWLKRAKAEKAKARMPVIAAPVRPAPNNDSRVVDARGVPKDGADLLAKVPELRDSPEAERIRKGYQALLKRDWQVTLVWWQEALKRDPNNAALKRSVDLAQWMASRQKETRPGATTLFNAAGAAVKKGDNQRALQLLQQLKKSNPAMTAPADRMIAEIHKRIAGLPQPGQDDIDLMFQSPYAAAVTAVTREDYSRALDLLSQVKRGNPALAITTDRMIANVKLLSPAQLPDPDDIKLLFPERAYAGPMSGSGLELFADGHGKKAQKIFDRIKLAMSRKAR
jgi:tetratricopeptide (TPR) repeat protein